MWPALIAAIPAAASALGIGGAAAGTGAAATGGSLLSGGLMGAGAEGLGSLALGSGGSGLTLADKAGAANLPGDAMMERISSMAADPNAPAAGMPEIPKPPGKAGPDVSGFANYGMTAPSLWDMGQFSPQQQLGSLMGMATQNYNEPDPFQVMQQGGLMDYMASLR